MKIYSFLATLLLAASASAAQDAPAAKPATVDCQPTTVEVVNLALGDASKKSFSFTKCTGAQAQPIKAELPPWACSLSTDPRGKSASDARLVCKMTLPTALDEPFYPEISTWITCSQKKSAAQQQSFTLTAVGGKAFQLFRLILKCGGKS